MCGRYASSRRPEDLVEEFDLDEGDLPPPIAPRWNVAPTDEVYAVMQRGERRLRVVRWGLVPSWAKEMKVGSKMINARAETVAEKPAFKPLLRKHRLIVPMDGFYEWKVVPGQKTKQPMFIHRADGEPLAVAGLWATWRDRDAGPDAPWLHSLTIITTSANEMMSAVHDRMPVVLPPERWAEWLDPGNQDVDALKDLLVPAPNDLLTMHPVSTSVNNVRNNSIELIDPVAVS